MQSWIVFFFRVDNAFLVSLVGLRPEKHFWIGLSNQENIDNFVWTNTAPVKYTHWNFGMPGIQPLFSSYAESAVQSSQRVTVELWSQL